MASAVAEVTLDLDTGRVVQWDMPVGDPHHPPAQTLIFMADDVAEALRGSTVTYPSGDTLEVTRDGIAKATMRGQPFIYELFPARFSDSRPYEPIVYIGRWPD